MEKEEQKLILDMSLSDFARACAACEPTPGGGAVAGYTGALGVALARMAMLYSLKRCTCRYGGYSQNCIYHRLYFPYPRLHIFRFQEIYYF